jgi:membrane protease YdiL (CAAX protease family)
LTFETRQQDSPNILFGPDGLRPGWGLLAFLSIALFVYFFSGTLLLSMPAVAPALRASAGRPATLVTLIFNDGPLLLAVTIGTWMMSKIERRPVGTYGLGGSRRVSHFLSGLGWGVLSLSLLVCLLWKMGLLVFTGRLLFGLEIAQQASIWILGFLLVSLTEEYAMRGYLQFTLTRAFTGIFEEWFQSTRARLIAFCTAALILSSLFGLDHGNNPGESHIGLLSAGLIGLLFCLTLWRIGSLWWALGFHAAWDWAQSFLFGVADSGTMVQGHLFATHPAGKVLLSGGATGPEGSLFVLPVLAAVTLVIFWTLPSKRVAV